VRLVPDQSRQISRAKQVPFFVDGQPVLGYLGQAVAVALLRAGQRGLHHAPSGGGPCGLFCCMGLCQECVVWVSGGVTESCRLAVQDGLRIDLIGRTPSAALTWRSWARVHPVRRRRWLR